ncbi:hypothetical protein [Singulisphaera sp. PoT]|uniref:hypothetical protein n=1 Tax=Singulisphaera sp. PoT TaxID=3411797 RepID=UPI003BF5E243
MRPLGFSTGAIAPGNLDEALRMLDGIAVEAVELSALRIRELPELLDFAERTDLGRFSHVSIHAPTDYSAEQEAEVVERLSALSDRGWPIVAHPDTIRDYRLWKQFGPLLLIENMDKRKPLGRTVEELSRVFDELPDAQMCFDIAHARQVDTSMTEAYKIAKAFRSRIKQIHISTIGSSSKHAPISPSAERSFRSLASLIPISAPAILETPVRADQFEEQLAMAARSLEMSLTGQIG